MQKHGREVATIEAWVRRGIADRWCEPVSWRDAPDAFRRRFRANLAMDCEDPIEIEVWGRYDRKCDQVKPIFVTVISRCRKCAACLKRKARFWTGRAMTEYQASPATYLVTLTLRPEMHYHFEAGMQLPLYRGRKLIRDAVAPERLATATQRFRQLAQEEGRAVTAYLDRIRKRARFRYLLVAERHMGNPSSEVFGKPHFHVLLHEQEVGALIKASEYQEHAGRCTVCDRWHKDAYECCDHAFVRTQWPHGFTKVVRCVDAKSAVYVCKYVSKDPMARVRASLGYGSLDGTSVSENATLDDVDKYLQILGVREDLTPEVDA